MAIFNEKHTLLEGVFLISDSQRYDFAHMNQKQEIESARIIDPKRIPSPEHRLERFCEEWSVRLKKIESRIFQNASEFNKAEQTIINGLSGAVDKNFPEAIEYSLACKVAARHGLSRFMDRITTEPLIQKGYNESLILPRNDKLSTPKP